MENNEIWFAWYPVKTNIGWAWLRNVIKNTEYVFSIDTSGEPCFITEHTYYG